MIPFQLQLAAVPEGGGLVLLKLEPFQQEAMENYLNQLLTDAQCQLLDDGLVRMQGAVLLAEIEQELSS
jgi:hypothetical protein